MSIRCTSRYRSNAGVYSPGQQIDDLPLEKFLLKDSPGSFEVISGHDAPVVEIVEAVEDESGAEADEKSAEAEVTKPAPKPSGRWAARTK